MKKIVLSVVSVGLLALGQNALAAPDFNEVNTILSKNACLSCHTIDKKVVGPAYTEVAAKRAGEADAAEVLAKHIREGSSGVYGSIPMPPNKGISDADIQTVVEWLVAGAPH